MSVGNMLMRTSGSSIKNYNKKTYHMFFSTATTILVISILINIWIGRVAMWHHMMGNRPMISG